MSPSFALYPNGWNTGTCVPISRTIRSLTVLNLSVLYPIHDTPYLNPWGIAAWRDKGSQLLALHRRDSRRSKKCKHSIFTSVFRLAESEIQPNILIDLNGSPRLTDFGLSSTTRNISSANDSTPNGRGSTRWKAPELLALSIKPKDQDRVKEARPTKESDAYSLAMVAIEVTFSSLAQDSVSHSFEHLQIFTGRIPFDSYGDEQVILLLAKDSRPDKPVHEQFNSNMWTLTKRCWNKDPKKRPGIPEVLRKLESRDSAFSNTHPGCCLLLRKCTGNNRYTLFPTSLPFFTSRISLQFGDRSDTNRQG